MMSTVPYVEAPPSLTVDEAIKKAIDLREDILADAMQAEDRGSYSEQLHLEFVRAGFYNLLRPKMFGGYEFSMWDFLRVMREIAVGDMSTGWSLTFASGHVHQVAAYWPESVQRSVFATPYFAATLTGAPMARLSPHPDGWVIEGTAPYSTGAAYSTHFIGKGWLDRGDGSEPVLSQYMVGREDVVIRDDWGSLLGMRGSASNTVDIPRTVIPHDWALVGQELSNLDVSEGTPGWKLHRNPLYAGRSGSFFALEPAAVQIGGAYAALAELERQLRDRPAPEDAGAGMKRWQHPRYQMWYADAVAGLAAADATLQRAAELYTGLAERTASGGTPFSHQEDLHVDRVAKHAQLAAWNVLQSQIIRSVGSSAMGRGQRLERIWRDSTMILTHVGSTNAEFRGMEFARLALGTPAFDTA